MIKLLKSFCSGAVSRLAMFASKVEGQERKTHSLTWNILPVLSFAAPMLNSMAVVYKRNSIDSDVKKVAFLLAVALIPSTEL